MSVDRLFGTKELIKALIALNFKPKKQVGSSHNKWCPDGSRERSDGQRPFIIVIQKEKQYCKKTCNSYIRQLMRLGYEIEEIKQAFS